MRPIRLDSLTALVGGFRCLRYPMANPAPIPVQPVLALGQLGATSFFVLSGFGLTWSWSDRTPPSTFLWRRFARIYPVHLVALVIAVPIFYAIARTPTSGR